MTETPEATIARLTAELAEAQAAAGHAMAEADHLAADLVKAEAERDAMVGAAYEDAADVAFGRNWSVTGDLIMERTPASATAAYTAAIRAAHVAGLREAANVPRPDVSRRYCTNDEAFFNEGFSAAISAILAAATAKENENG